MRPTSTSNLIAWGKIFIKVAFLGIIKVFQILDQCYHITIDWQILNFIAKRHKK